MKFRRSETGLLSPQKVGFSFESCTILITVYKENYSQVTPFLSPHLMRIVMTLGGDILIRCGDLFTRQTAENDDIFAENLAQSSIVCYDLSTCKRVFTNEF